MKTQKLKKKQEQTQNEKNNLIQVVTQTESYKIT